MASRLYSIRGVQSGVGGGPHPTRFAGHLPQRGKALETGDDLTVSRFLAFPLWGKVAARRADG